MTASDLKEEWCLQQTQFDSYEKHSLAIKLMSVAVTVIGGVSNGKGTTVCIAVLLVLWLQDAIWKTFQSRIEQRLLKVEQALADNAAVTAFQFNRDFADQRRGLSGLLQEYIGQAARPTVAYPHAVLVLITVLNLATRGNL